MNNKSTKRKSAVFLLSLLSCIAYAKTVEIENLKFSDTLLNVGAGQPSISICDFNLDGNNDVIIANYADDDIIFFQGNGEGVLTELGRFSAGENPTGLSISDINNDGNADVAVVNHETSYVTLLLGDGKGSFKKAPQSPLHVSVKPHPHAIKLRDLDGDKISELIVDSRDNDGLLVMQGLSDGKFKTPGKIIDVGGDPYRGFAVGDINHDGALDIVTPNQRDIGIVINSGSSISFSLTKLAQSESPFAVELVDLNGDSKLDLVVATNGNSLTIFPGDGRGNFQDNTKTVIKTASGAKQIAKGDLNGDGIEDALVSNWSGELLAIIGNQVTLETYKFKHGSIPNPWGVALTDLNKDGKSDFIIADGNSKLAVVYVSQN